MTHLSSEQFLAVAEREGFHKETIRSNVLCEAAERRPFAWKRVWIPAAVCIAALLITVLSIPSARAEVLSWFGVGRPAEQHLIQPPSGQTSADELIVSVSPDPAESRVLRVVDEPIWQQIAADFSITPDKTLFDGTELYLSLTIRGIGALPQLDALTGGSATGMGPEEDAAVSIFLLLPDGTELSMGPIRGLDRNEGCAAYQYEIFDAYPAPRTEETLAAISERNARWLSGRELKCDVSCDVRNPKTGEGVGTVMLRDGKEIGIPDVWMLLCGNADANGILTANVRYRAEAERDGRQITLLEADLGTAVFDLFAYKRLETYRLCPRNAEIVFPDGTAVLSCVDWASEAHAVTVTNTEVSLRGLTFRAADGGHLNGLGVWDATIAVRMPDAWTPTQRDAFLAGLSFDTELDGVRSDGGSFALSPGENGEVLLTYSNRQLPFDRLDGAKTVRLIPVLHTYTHLRTADGKQIPIPLNTPVAGSMWEADDCSYPDCAITLDREP